MRLLLSRFELVGKGRSPCSEHPSATSIAAQQNRETLGSCSLPHREPAVNWEMVGALAEAVGATAVVVSLLYLGRQLREGTVQSKASAYSSVMGRTTHWLADLGRDRESSAIYLKGLSGGLSGLDEIERVRFILLVLGLMRLLEEAFLHRHHGSFPDWSNAAVEGSITDLMVAPGFQDFWALRRHQFSSEFQGYIDALDTSAGRAVHGQAPVQGAAAS